MTDLTRRIPWARLGLEFVVIVVGILLALAIESWWQGRADDAKVRTYLGALEDDLLSDSIFYADVASPRMVRKREVLDAIGPVVRGRAPVPADTLGFLDEVALGGLFGIPGGFSFAETTTMDELVATGALALFESAELRAELTLYYSLTAALAERARGLMPNYPLYVHAAYPAELRDEKTDGKVRAFGVRRALEHFLSPEFETVMNQEYNYMLYIDRSLRNWNRGSLEMLVRVRCARGLEGACAELTALDAAAPELESAR
jgi:hypothetical protein